MSSKVMTTEETVIPQDNDVFINFIPPLYLSVQRKGAIRIAQ